MDAITVAGEVVSTVPPLPIRPFAPRPQHLTRPDCSTAQVCEVPADTASAGSLPSSACTGVELEPVLPFPSSPFHPFPQHLTAPVVITAQVWFPPAVIETAPVSASTGWTVIPEEKLPIADPLWPKQCTDVSDFRTQVWLVPAATAVTFDNPGTTRGTADRGRGSPESLGSRPSCPWVFKPQQYTDPPAT